MSKRGKINFKKEINFLKKEINKRLRIFLDKKIRQTTKISSLTARMIQSIKNFVLRGGKRIRPILFCYGYFAAGGKNKKAILDTSISIELIHNYLLVHDDIIDRDELRRGGPTIHKKYKEIYKKTSKDFEHLGTSAGILIGDFLSTFGSEALIKANFPEHLKIKALNKLSQILANVQIGEILDVFLKIEHSLNKEEVFKVINYKTTKYTIEGPLHLGAILAGARPKTLKKLSQYALPLGIAFQIQDDILGMFGKPKDTGKPAGADLREGKQTLLIFKSKKLANKKEKKVINSALGNPKLTKNQLENVRKIIIRTGSLDFCQKFATNLANQSKLAIGNSNFSFEIKDFLTRFADFIIEREK